MPERHFEVRWPDGHQDRCYSPSSTVENYLTVGEEYSLTQFLEIADQALHEASERVRKKYGYACSSAMDQLSKIQERATQFKNQEDACVLVVQIS